MSAHTQQKPPAEPEAATGEEASEVEDDPPPSVPLDVVFGILKNERRRLVLQYMGETESQTSLSDLAEHIAAIENGKPASELDSQERKRVYVGLYQCHLPRMHDSGAIEFDKNRGTVEPGQNIEQFYEYLDQPEPDVRPWSVYYLALAGVSIALLAGTLLLFEAATIVAFFLSIAAFAGLSLFHASQDEA